MTWTPGKMPDARKIQRAYVNARVHELNRVADRVQRDTVQALQYDLSKNIQMRELFLSHAKAKRTFLNRVSESEAEDYFEILNDALQLRELTINFHATSWFETENKYETYTQIYQRGVNKETGDIALLGDNLNPPAVRGFFDDIVTLPQSWSTPARGLKPNVGIAGAMRLGHEIPSVPIAQGENPMLALSKVLNRDIHDPGGLMDEVRFMGPLQEGVADPNWDEKLKWYRRKPKNEKFMPDTRQIFVALNYGKRPHGSNVKYGYSHLVVHPRFKPDAIYFAGDTFNKIGVGEQVSFQCLAALYFRGTLSLRETLIQSCLGGQTLGDTDQTDYLVEAHLFNSIKFERYDIIELRLENEAFMERKRKKDAEAEGYVPPDKPLPPFAVVAANAEKFCQRWKIKFRQM